MPKNKIEDLRNILFETLEKLMDEDDPMDLERADTIGKVAQVVVNSAKVEVDFIKQTGHGGSGFIQGLQPAKPVGRLAAFPALDPIDITPETPHEELCQRCTLPECADTSEHCLVRIQRRIAA